MKWVYENIGDLQDGSITYGSVFLAYPSYVGIQKEAGDDDIVTAEVRLMRNATVICNIDIYFDAEGKCTIDLTEFIRTFAIGDTGYAEVTPGSVVNRRRFYYKIQGIESERALRHQPSLKQQFDFAQSDLFYHDDGSGSTLNAYLPPSYVFGLPQESMGCYFWNFRPCWSSSLQHEYDYNLFALRANGDAGSFKPLGWVFESFSLADPGGYVNTRFSLVLKPELVENTKEIYHTHVLRPIAPMSSIQIYVAAFMQNLHAIDNVPLAYVRWQNRFGYTNCFAFEIHDIQRITDDTLSIDASPSQAYSIKKTFHYQGVIFRNAVTAYDIWFFSDITTSNNVQISFINNASVEDQPDWHEIDITTKKITVPASDAKGRYNLNIDFNFEPGKQFLF